MNDLFEVHILNEEGIAAAKNLAETFSSLLDSIEVEIGDSREAALCRTHLEIASFYAKKAMAIRRSKEIVEEDDKLFQTAVDAIQRIAEAEAGVPYELDPL